MYWAYRWYVLALLGLIYSVHAMDRTVINLILEPIKREFGLSDSALGLLTGLGYALPFSIAGLPLGALVDRANRKQLLATLVTTWSVFTVLGGFARGFYLLLATRMAVGAAESGSPPTALALVSDYFPPRVRASAVSIFYVGAPLGAILAAQVSQLTAPYGWRATLFAAALPGLILAAILALTVREPVRGSMEPTASTVIDPGVLPAPFRAVFALIAREPSLALILAALVFMALSTVGVSTWIPALLMRGYGLPVGQASSIMALAGLIGVGGTLLGGFLSDIYARGRASKLLVLAGTANLVQVLPLLGALSAPGVAGFKYPFLLWTVLHTVNYGAGFGVALGLAPPQMRGRLMAVTFVLANILGAGLGPQIVGLLSDSFSRGGDASALPHAIRALAIAAGLSGALFLAALKFVPAGLTRALAEKREPTPAPVGGPETF